MGEYNFGGYLSTGWNYSLTSVRGSYDGDGTTLNSSLDFLTSSTVRMKIAHNGNVGIGTTQPTEKLDNNGITRLRTLPLNGTSNAIFTMPDGNMSSAQNQIFTATRTIVADTNGVLGYINGLPQNIYTANGSLTSARTLTTGNNSLTFDVNSLQQTFWSPTNGSLNQMGLASSPTKHASIILTALDNNGNSIASSLHFQIYPEQPGQILATSDAKGLSIGTNGNTNSAPISFTTSAGGNAPGTEKMIITGTGNVGINTSSPSSVARLHVVKTASDLTPAIIQGCNTYADNTAATAAGLPIGGLYRKSDGTLMVRY